MGRLSIISIMSRYAPEPSGLDWIRATLSQEAPRRRNVKREDAGYQRWRKALPPNLRREADDYDLYGAYRAGLGPRFENDGYYHLGSRDPRTGRILKRPNHPKFYNALHADWDMGYYPTWDIDGNVYTKPLFDEQYRLGGRSCLSQDDPRRRVRYKAKGGTWSDRVSLTNKGLEGQGGINYYYDNNGYITDSANPNRKGTITLDDVVVTPRNGYIDENGRMFNTMLSQGNRYGLRLKDDKRNEHSNFKFNGSPIDNFAQARYLFSQRKDPFHALSDVGIIPVNLDNSEANVGIGGPMRSAREILQNAGKGLYKGLMKTTTGRRLRDYAVKKYYGLPDYVNLVYMTK